MQRVVPASFVNARVSLSWRAVAYGVAQGWWLRQDAVDHAIGRLLAGSDDPLEIELAGLHASELYAVPDLLEQLVARDRGVDLVPPEVVWMRLLMAWAFSNRASLADPLAAVEEIYAGFGYPTEIQGLVRYMPGDASAGLTPAEAVQDLMRRWGAYVDAVFSSTDRVPGAV